MNPSEQPLKPKRFWRVHTSVFQVVEALTLKEATDRAELRLIAWSSGTPRTYIELFTKGAQLIEDKDEVALWTQYGEETPAGRPSFFPSGETPAIPEKAAEEDPNQNLPAKKAEPRDPTRWNEGKPWAQHDIDYLRRNYRTATMEELVSAFSRSPKAISRRAEKLGLKKMKTEARQVIKALSPQAKVEQEVEASLRNGKDPVRKALLESHLDDKKGRSER